MAGSTTAWGVFAGRLAGEMLLPVAGLGFAAALHAEHPLVLGAAIALGAVVGALTRSAFLASVALLPNAATHAFLVGPIAGLAVGAALVLPGRAGRFALPVAAGIAGATGWIAIRLLDPSLRDPAVPLAGAAALLALLLLTLAIARALPAAARHLGSRILGAWVLAVALLYGGATLSFRGRMVAPDATGRMGPAERTPFPDFAPPAAGSVP